MNFDHSFYIPTYRLIKFLMILYENTLWRGVKLRTKYYAALGLILIQIHTWILNIVAILAGASFLRYCLCKENTMKWAFENYTRKRPLAICMMKILCLDGHKNNTYGEIKRAFCKELFILGKLLLSALKWTRISLISKVLRYNCFIYF